MTTGVPIPRTLHSAKDMRYRYLLRYRHLTLVHPISAFSFDAYGYQKNLPARKSLRTARPWLAADGTVPSRMSALLGMAPAKVDEIWAENQARFWRNGLWSEWPSSRPMNRLSKDLSDRWAVRVLLCDEARGCRSKRTDAIDEMREPLAMAAICNATHARHALKNCQPLRNIADSALRSETVAYLGTGRSTGTCSRYMHVE